MSFWHSALETNGGFRVIMGSAFCLPPLIVLMVFIIIQNTVIKVFAGLFFLYLLWQVWKKKDWILVPSEMTLNNFVWGDHARRIQK